MNAPRSFRHYAKALSQELRNKGYAPSDRDLILEGLQEQLESMLETVPLTDALRSLPTGDDFETLADPRERGGHQPPRALAIASLLGVLLMFAGLLYIEWLLTHGAPQNLQSLTALILLLGYPMTFALGVVTREHPEGMASALSSGALFSIAVVLLLLDAIS